MTIDELDDVPSLRQAAKLLQAENREMARMIARLQKELRNLKGSPEQLTLQMAGLEQQLAALRNKAFGDSSEKRSKGDKKPLEDEKKQTGHGRREQPALPIIPQIHLADEADKICTACGGGLVEWEGQFEESEEIDILERQFVLKKHQRQKYRCKCGQCIDTAPGPVKLFDGARYSPNLGVHVAMAKYADHMPLERQVRGMHRDGLEIDSQTLWDQTNAIATLLAPAQERLHAY